MTTTPNLDHLRTVRVSLTADTMGRLLGIPDGARVVAVESRIDPCRTDVIVWSPTFPPKEYGPDSESPYVPQAVVETWAGDQIRAVWSWPRREDGEHS